LQSKHFTPPRPHAMACVPAAQMLPAQHPLQVAGEHAGTH
jgi:hypothetical protein